MRLTMSSSGCRNEGRLHEAKSCLQGGKGHGTAKDVDVTNPEVGAKCLKPSEQAACQLVPERQHVSTATQGVCTAEFVLQLKVAVSVNLVDISTTRWCEYRPSYMQGVVLVSTVLLSVLSPQQPPSC